MLQNGLKRDLNKAVNVVRCRSPTTAKIAIVDFTKTYENIREYYHES